MGYLPDIYKDFIKQYPDINKSYDALANSCHKAGPLDKKTRRLVKLGIAIGLIVLVKKLTASRTAAAPAAGTPPARSEPAPADPDRRAYEERLDDELRDLD